MGDFMLAHELQQRLLEILEDDAGAFRVMPPSANDVLTAALMLEVELADHVDVVRIDEIGTVQPSRSYSARHCSAR